MLGIRATGGLVRARSQLTMVAGSTPIELAVWLWVRPRRCRQRLMCSPMVCGLSGNGSGFRDLSWIAGPRKRATRPCPCGYLGDSSGRCGCTPDQVARYRDRVSGPLMDRIDLQVFVPRVDRAVLTSQEAPAGESSEVVRERVVAAWTRQLERAGKSNALLASRELDRDVKLDRAARSLMETAMVRLSLSARGYHRVLRVARTIADLAGSAAVLAPHVAEAVRMREMDRAG